MVTVAPPELRLFPLASLAVTVSTWVLVPSAVMLALTGVKTDTVALAAPAVPVAVKVTGLPLKLPDVAVIVLLPAVVPNVQLPTVAIPLASVVADKPVADPPPVATAKVTLTPLTGLLLASLTITLGAVDTADPAVALWLFPALTAIWVAVPAVPVAVKVTGLPLKLPDVAVIVLLPAVVPNVQVPALAIPEASVV